MTIKMNSALQSAALARDYAVKKRLQLPEFLEPPSAHEAYESLHGLPWGMAYNDGSTVHQLSPEQIAAMDDRKADEITAGIQERARTEFQFLYAFFPILQAYTLPTRYKIFDFLEFLNSSAVLDFIRGLTGIDQIRWADAQATWYRPVDGRRTAIASFTKKGHVVFTPPGGPANGNDWVLILEK